jgi:hypothetical protein
VQLKPYNIVTTLEKSSAKDKKELPSTIKPEVSPFRKICN